MPILRRDKESADWHQLLTMSKASVNKPSRMNRSIKKQNKTNLLADKTKKKKRHPFPFLEKEKPSFLSSYWFCMFVSLRQSVFSLPLPSLPSIGNKHFIILECGFSCCCFPWVIGERQREKETFGFCCAITRCTLRQRAAEKEIVVLVVDGRKRGSFKHLYPQRNPHVMHTILKKIGNSFFFLWLEV